MLASYSARFILAVVLFGLTVAFAAAGFGTALVDLHAGIYVWENDLVYITLTVSLGLLCLMVCRNMLPSREANIEIVPLEDFFPQD